MNYKMKYLNLLLMQTRGMVLAHSTGDENPYKTIVILVMSQVFAFL